MHPIIGVTWADWTIPLELENWRRGTKSFLENGGVVKLNDPLLEDRGVESILRRAALKMYF
jgi:hypothetical protein